MPTSERMVAVGAHGLAGSRTDLPSAPLSDLEWFDLVRGCVAADLVGLLGCAAGDGHLPVTTAQAEELDVLAAEHAGLSALVERHAVTMSSLLTIAGIDHRIVDGPALNLAYPSATPHRVRPARTVRVLVAADRLADAVALQGVPPTRADGAVARAPRLQLVDRLPGLDPGPSGDLPSLLGPPTRVDLDGRSVPVLTLDQQLVVACAAQAFTPVPSLSALRDVAQLALSPGLDTRAAQRLADRLGVSDALAGGMAQSWTWFDLADKTPLSVWALRRAARPAERSNGGAARVGLAQRVLGRRPAMPDATVGVPVPAMASPAPTPGWPDAGPVPSSPGGRPRRSNRRSR